MEFASILAMEGLEGPGLHHDGFRPLPFCPSHDDLGWPAVDQVDGLIEEGFVAYTMA